MNRYPLLVLVGAACVAATPMLAQAENAAAKMADQQITQEVKQKLSMNDPTVAPHILVSTRDGVVTLMGMAVPEGRILTAVHDAESVGGVVRVDNRLKPE